MFRFISPDRLKVVLTAQDVEQMDIDWESRDAAKIKKLRRYLLGILAQAQSQAENSFLLFGERLVIEIYPEDDGGATVYFIMEQKEAACSVCKPVLFCFEDAETLICGALRIFSLYGHRLLQSSLYLSENSWQLIIRPIDGQDGAATGLLSEYGRRVDADEVFCAIIEEHCKPIIRERAVDLLSYYFA